MKLRIFLKIRQFFEVLRVLRGSGQLAQNGTLFSVSLLGAGGFCTKLYALTKWSAHERLSTYFISFRHNFELEFFRLCGLFDFGIQLTLSARNFLFRYFY